jgi:hypothetical protein
LKVVLIEMKPLVRLALVLTGVLAVVLTVSGQPLGIHRELYLGLGSSGDSMAQLTNHPNFLAGRPDRTNIFANIFETETNRGDDYGQRLRGFLTAPSSGNYTFWIASDEISQLYLSLDENPANKRLIAFVDPRSQPRIWTTHAGQQSTNLALEAGRRYYLEVLHKEGLLLDHLAVRWRLPNGTMEEPIPGSRFVYELPPLLVASLTNALVEEGRSVTFSAALANFLPQRYRWQRDDADLAGATNQTLTLPVAALADHGARFRVFVSNSVGATNSDEAVLSVRPDTNAPVLLQVLSASPRSLLLRFSEPLATNSALNLQNYALSNATITAAAFAFDAQTILLNTSPLSQEGSYTLAFSNILDQAGSPNRILPGQVTFLAREFNPQIIGSPGLPGSLTTVTDGADLTAGGGGTSGARDQFQFAYQLQSGDFDLKIRLVGLDAGDLWATAGLMARESLDDSSRFAAVFTTPSLSGCFFEQRSATGGLTARTGSAPVTYPNTWLRLKRAGDTFTGSASADGDRWTQLGSVTMVLPLRVYFGLAVSSHRTNELATARFRDFSNVTSGAAGSVADDREPLGPSSRKTGLVISEIMYHPRALSSGVDEAALEFVELFNSNPFYEDISGYRLSGDVDFMFPPGTLLAGGAFLVIAKSPAALRAAAGTGMTNVFGPFDGRLPNDSGRVRLRNDSGHVLLEVNYSAKFPWPLAADGTGHSLVLARPSHGEGRREAWAASDEMGGSPGRADPFGVEALRPVVLNEFYGRAEGAVPAFIELYNHSNREIDLSGAFLTVRSQTNQFRLPPNTKIPPRGFLSFDQSQLGFAINPFGDRLFLINSTQTRVIDAVGFDGQAIGISTGRSPDGSPLWHELAAPTRGQSNAPQLIRDVVINEIMYHPISENSDDEYVELFNRGTNTINLGGWKFTDGIDFTFPANAIVPGGGYLVVAKNLTNLLTRYPKLNRTNTVGNFDGNLNNGGERLALAMPQVAASPLNRSSRGNEAQTSGPQPSTLNSQPTDQSLLTSAPANTAFVVVDEVDYKTGGQWGRWADGGGSSLELVDPRADHRLGPNWADSDETAKAPWTNVEVTGVLDNAASSSDPPNTLHVMLLEAGECLLDDVEVMPANTANRVANPGFETGLTGWIPRGNHIRSSWETNGGFNSARSLHIRATSQGDISANRIRIPLTPALTVGQTATIRAKARWLAGWPEILLRLRGSGLEAFGRLAVPSNPGTPGERNSRARDNAGPAIHNVSHAPAVPAAIQPVVVTARAADPDGIQSFALRFRIDPGTNFTAVAMQDDGANGDAVAGDGEYSATIPGQPADTVVAFVIDAIDGAANAASSRFPDTPADNSPARECVVHFGGSVPSSSFGTYRFWITQSTINAWTNREVLSNERLFGTFVYGDHRVIYNAGGRYSGSPAHQDQAGPVISPVGSPYSFAFDLPKDDLLLGTDNFNKVHASGNNIGDDNSLQRETTVYWMARQLGLAANYKRYVQFFVNGLRRGTLYEDTQVPGAAVVDSVFPDDNEGDLFKLSIWYEFDQANTQVLGSRGSGGTTLNNYTTTGGVKKTARYRWNWQPRALNGTANNFTNVFALVDAANTSINLNNRATIMENLEALADIGQWMRTFALEHAVGNWDSFGFRNAQNMYAYKPQQDRWQLLIWDANIVFGGGTRGTPVGPTGDNLLEYAADDVPLGRIYTTPKYLRWYWQALQEVAEGPMDNARVAPVLDARSTALSASGVEVAPTGAVKTWIALRRDYLLQRAAVVDTPAFLVQSPNNSGSATNIVNLSGVAPLRVKTITVNGSAWPVTWSTVTNWTAQFTLNARTNTFSIQGLDRAGNLMVGGATATITYTGDLSPPPRVLINEWMADNTRTVADPADGDYEDWFELFNAGASAVDLSGYFLADTLTNKTQWAIPRGTTIAPGGFLLVWADGEVSQPGPGLHANFRLSQNGDTIALFAPDGTRIDAVTFGAQTNDVSQGRWPDGATNVYSMAATPNAANFIASSLAPRFLSYALLSGNRLELTWTVVAGRTYRVEYKNDLNDTAWSSLGGAMLAQANQLALSDILAPGAKRFYRLVLDP